MNSVVIIGRLTRNPELSYTPNTQTACCRFTLAVDRPKREGQDQGADFIRITVWGRQAENCDRYLAKGRQVAVLGRIQTGSYKNREGVTVYTTDVVADRVEFLGGGQGNAQGNQDRSYQGGTQGENSRFEGSSRREERNIRPREEKSIQEKFDYPEGFAMADDDVPEGFATADDGIPF